ncbi:MAG TPA: AAA family ATPase [Acetobacteraceae bacterium]|nr:AAA family ATPase [Acetobacteraceae bacterium]
MSAGFVSLSIHGYRRLKATNLLLRPLNVLIGANGVGKTSVLDAFQLLGASAARRLAATVLEAGGLQSVLTADGATRMLDLRVSFKNANGEIIGYELTLTETGVLPVITVHAERLFETPASDPTHPRILIEAEAGQPRYPQQGMTPPPLTAYDHSETALAQSPPFGDAPAFRHLLAGISAIYHGLDVSKRARIKSPQLLHPAQTPGSNGEDLLSCLWTIRETARDRFEDIEHSLRVAFPDFERLEFPPVAAGMFSLGWRDKKFSRPLYASELSEGTLRFLWLATLLQSPDLPAVTLIDEPEVSLHPELLRILTELMREASERTQLVVATHSDRFVRFLRPEEIIVCDLNDSGGMTVQWADELNLKSWLEDYTLDQLWSQGVLGGRS